MRGLLDLDLVPHIWRLELIQNLFDKMFIVQDGDKIILGLWINQIFNRDTRYLRNKTFDELL